MNTANNGLYGKYLEGKAQNFGYLKSLCLASAGLEI